MKNYVLSGEGAIRNSFYVQSGSTEGAFYSEGGSKILSERYPQQRGSLLIQKTVQKTMIVKRRTVAQRTISTRRTVEKSMVLIWGEVLIRRAVVVGRFRFGER